MINGQHQGYLYLQLRDYKNGDRKNDVMSSIAGALERSDMMALAEYFSQKPWPDLRQPRPSDAATARALRSQHVDRLHRLSSRRIPGLRHPAAARRPAEGLSAADDARLPHPQARQQSGMSDLMIAASEDDLVAMAEYLAGR